jgi:hypothetical protein
MIFSNSGVTSTIGTKALTEWQVNVQTDALFTTMNGVGPGQRFFPEIC